MFGYQSHHSHHGRSKPQVMIIGIWIGLFCADMFVEEWPFLTSLNLWIPPWTDMETLWNPQRHGQSNIFSKYWAIQVSLGAVLITMDVGIEVFKAHHHVLAVTFCKCRLLDLEDLSPMTPNCDTSERLNSLGMSRVVLRWDRCHPN